MSFPSPRFAAKRFMGNFAKPSNIFRAAASSHSWGNARHHVWGQKSRRPPIAAEAVVRLTACKHAHQEILLLWLRRSPPGLHSFRHLHSCSGEGWGLEVCTMALWPAPRTSLHSKHEHEERPSFECWELWPAEPWLRIWRWDTTVCSIRAGPSWSFMNSQESAWDFGSLRGSHAALNLLKPWRGHEAFRFTLGNPRSYPASSVASSRVHSPSWRTLDSRTAHTNRLSCCSHGRFPLKIIWFNCWGFRVAGFLSRVGAYRVKAWA